MGQHSLLSLSCFVAAGAWPTIVTAIGNALMSPLERAVRVSICGAPFHTAPELFGHCAACWAGSAILAATGIIVCLERAPRGSLIEVKRR